MEISVGSVPTRENSQSSSTTISRVDIDDDYIAKKAHEYQIIERVTKPGVFHIRPINSRHLTFKLNSNSNPTVPSHPSSNPNPTNTTTSTSTSTTTTAAATDGYEHRLYDAATQCVLFTLTWGTAAKSRGVRLLYLHDARSGVVAYTVRRKRSVVGSGRGTLLVVKGKCDDIRNRADVCMCITSDLWRSKAVVSDFNTRTVRAVITRSAMAARKITTGIDSCKIKVYQGTDVALITMLTVCFDELYSDFIQ